jgi:hypothetical protein
LADPLPGYGTQTREAGYYQFSVYRNISDHDKINPHEFQAWLTAEMSCGELKDITEPAANGWGFPWPLLGASVSRLSALLTEVTKVVTCRLVDHSIGLMFHRRVSGDVVIVHMSYGYLFVLQGDEARRAIAVT